MIFATKQKDCGVSLEIVIRKLGVVGKKLLFYALKLHAQKPSLTLLLGYLSDLQPGSEWPVTWASYYHSLPGQVSFYLVSIRAVLLNQWHFTECPVVFGLIAMVAQPSLAHSCYKDMKVGGAHDGQDVILSKEAFLGGGEYKTKSQQWSKLHNLVHCFWWQQCYLQQCHNQKEVHGKG